jgi:hypothetical protein
VPVLTNARLPKRSFHDVDGIFPASLCGHRVPPRARQLSGLTIVRLIPHAQRKLDDAPGQKQCKRHNGEPGIWGRAQRLNGLKRRSVDSPSATRVMVW